MVQAVADDGVLFVEQRLKHPTVGVEGRSVQDGVFRVVEVCNALFQLFVDVLGSADEADAGHAKPVGVDCAFGRLHHPWVGTQPEVVVGAKVQDFAAVVEGDFRVLRRGDDALTLVQARGVDVCQLLGQLVFDASKHAGKVQPARPQVGGLQPRMNGAFLVP